MNELKDTIKLMKSKSYKKRFQAEYYQTLIRANKLYTMIQKFKNNELDFEPTCPISTLELQHRIMLNYLDILQFRADIENIDL